VPTIDQINAMAMQIPGMQNPQFIDQAAPMPQQPGIAQTLTQDLLSPASQAFQPAPPVVQPQQPVAPAASQDALQQAQALPPEAMAQAPVNQDPAGLGAYNKEMQSGLKMQEQALKEQYNAVAQQAKENAVANVAFQGETQKLMNEFQAFNDKNQANIDATVEDIKNNVINPKAYQESLTTGNKIMAAIGLMAGGFARRRSGP
jgi:hypothetical protein